MKRKLECLVSIFLVLTMCFGLFGNMALAAKTTEVNVVKTLSTTASGKCGDNLTWILKDGILTISGTGDMWNWEIYAEGIYPPWYSYAKLIKTVIIQKGVTSLGAGAFHYCSSLTDITLPNSLITIGSGAFGDCYSLKNITLSDSIKNIGSESFACCRNLVNITIGSNIENIASYAFAECNNLVSITFKGNAPTFGEYCFGSSVTATAYYPCNNSTWTSSKRQNYGGKITWKSYTPTESSLSGDEKKVKSMLKRTSNTTRPMSEYCDPNDIVLDYLSTSDLSKMVITTTGKHISSSAMWQEAYRRTLVKMCNGNAELDLLSTIDVIDSINGQLSGLVDDALETNSVEASYSTISLIVAAMHDEVDQLVTDSYILEVIYESTNNKDLKTACEQILQAKMTNFNTAVLRTIAEKLPEVTKTVLEKTSKYFTSKLLGKISTALNKGLGYTCKALEYVEVVLFVKDIVTTANGWSDLTEAYQDSVADTYIREALYKAYGNAITAYTKSNKNNLSDIGLIFQYIVNVTQDSYSSMKTVLGKKYSAVLAFDTYLKNRTNEVPKLSITTYKKTSTKYMTPTCTKSYTLVKGKTKVISLSNVRYSVTKKYKVTSGSKYISVNSQGKVTAKSVGKGTVAITVKQNGGKTYNLTSTISVKPVGSEILSLKNSKNKQMTVKWKKDSSSIGYEIQYSTSSTFKSGNTKITISKKNTTSTNISKLTKNKKYYVRIRTYNTISKKKYYSSWSKSKVIKITK